MTGERSNEFIESALKQGFLHQVQADLLKEELSMFPGGNVLSMMIRRGILSPDQARELENPSSEDASTGSADDADMDLDSDGFGDFKIISNSGSNVQTMAVEPQQAAPAFVGNSTTFTRQVSPPTSSVSDSQVRPGRSVADALGEARKALHTPTLQGVRTQLEPDPYMVKLLKIGRERQCSDLHITVSKPPYMRQEGKLLFLEEPPVTEQMAQRLAYSVLTAEQRAEFEQARQVDFSFECAGAGRFRANVYQQRTGIECAFRFISETVPTLAMLKLPTVLEKLTTYPQGLNLVTGSGGCGKTSTVAAMLEYINCHRHDHIITVEDPVEIVFQPKSCQITQREVGTHTDSFATALRTALRQDPDVIMIGELRDLETTSISITAAETGHLVFGTLHTSSAARTVARILDVYPPAQRPQICMMVAESLRGIVSQQLLPRKDSRGRACAMEILLVTTGVAQMIKEGKTHQLVSHMQSGRKLGMMSMDDALMDLCQTGIISGSVAWSNAENKSLFDGLSTQA